MEGVHDAAGSGVTVGPGNLAGEGVYAAREFAAGEVVVAYRLQPLDEAEYRSLPDGEDLFVHSYGGRRYLYPAPARYVNHGDDPSCFQDFGRGCDVALRPIAAGEAVTIDATEETAHELGTFLDAYNAALRDPSLLGALVDADARLWLGGRSARGREAVVAGLLGSDPVTDGEWFVGTGRWEAVHAAGTGSGHVTLLLKVVHGNWQLIYQHGPT